LTWRLTFCFVKDAETASSAVRNLNGYELGGRQLRVDYADMDPAIEAQRQRERQHDVCICPNLINTTKDCN
jgi:RNA recognition motif-containing protein